MSEIPTLVTQDYPVRHVAIASPGVMVKHASPEKEAGFEWEVFYEPTPNAHYPHLTESIYVAIVSYQTEGLVVDCNATSPNRWRHTFSKVVRFPYHNLPQAEAFALKWIGIARRMVESAVADAEAETELETA